MTKIKHRVQLQEIGNRKILQETKIALVLIDSTCSLFGGKLLVSCLFQMELQVNRVWNLSVEMRIGRVLLPVCLSPAEKSMLQHFVSILTCKAQCLIADTGSNYLLCLLPKCALELQHTTEVLKVCCTSVLCLADKNHFLFSFLF